MNVDNTVDQVSKLSEAISKYGPYAVILAVFLIVFLIMIAFMIKINNKFADQMIKQYNDMFKKYSDSITTQIATSLPKKDYNEEDIVEIFTKLNEVFKEECKKINEKTSSSRAAIYVFHNGTVASHGLPFFKMTCVSEWISRGSGFEEQISKHTNLNLALFSSLVEELYKTGEFVIIHGCASCEQQDSYSAAFTSNRAKTSVFTCVYDGDNRIMAFINAEFKECLSDSEIDNVKNVMKYACAKVQPVLEFSSYKGMKYN